MGQISRQLFLKAPVEKIWSLWMAVESTPEWVHGVQESEVTSGVREGVGLQWKEKCLFDIGGVLEVSHELTECDQEQKMVIVTELPLGGKMQKKAVFKSQEQQTEVQLEVEWDLGMAGAMIGDDAVQDMLENSFTQTLANLKKKVESDALG